MIDCGALQIQEDSKRPVGGEGGGLKDWHNWTHIEAEAQRVGPGEQVPARIFGKPDTPSFNHWIRILSDPVNM